MNNFADSLSTDSPTDNSLLHPWRRYVALGDSFTEGIGDVDPHSPGGYRGWADRVAEQLSVGVEDFAYANLAIRGRLITQIFDEQAGPALELKPDLVSLCAGGNDVIRPGGDPDAIADKLDALMRILATSGATILLFTGPDIRDTPVLGGIRGKVAIYNENVRTIAARYDAVVADMWSLRELHQPHMWADDRLHFSPLGHQTIAAMALDALNVSHELEHASPGETEPKNWREARREDLIWARTHLAPWVLRRIRHQSSGDGITPKRPLAVPFSESTTAPSLGTGSTD
ncbi:SGNH/GDSL hydrolase family protein [Paeniglutamicibacter sp. R2-26]|uniref:SGNH/GDSL hydrolase family protein n=1 Tax=Paeniglutamicibacter sp. R2-26 TaxID=3144417 RepID=UPI003EE80843